MRFRILYILFFICQLLYGSLYIGGVITPRQLMAIIMLFACILEERIVIDKYWKVYLVFIVCFLFSSALTGNLADFFRLFLGYYFVAYVGYRSTTIMITKYSGLHVIIKMLLIIGVFDAIATIGQMFSIGAINKVIGLVHLGPQEQYYEIIDTYGGLNGFAVPGLLGPVLNGYYLSAMCILALYNKSIRLGILNIGLWLFFAISLFFVQQRAALATGLILSLLIMYKLLSANSAGIKPFLILTATSFVIFFAKDIFIMLMNSNTRYAEVGFELTNREGLYQQAWQYFLRYPLGCFFKFKQDVGYPHNLFLNALIYGGIFGAISILTLLLWQLKVIIPKLFKPIRESNIAIVLSSCMLLAYILISITHNSSIVTGDVTAWCYWGLVLSLIQNSERSNEGNHMLY